MRCPPAAPPRALQSDSQRHPREEKNFYRLPAFKKSSSLKVVLPTLIPKLSYEDLQIQEGTLAAASWPIVTDKNAPPAARKKLYQDMLDYCYRDVDGMVKILEHLKKIR